MTNTGPHATLRGANLARQAEWDTEGQITLSYRGNELAGEVGEACNIIKKLERERMGIKGSRASLADLAEELADVIICADLIALQLGIDLDRAVAEKFNKTSEKVGLATRMAEPDTMADGDGRDRAT
jgi:NTP pyrophosphatase (non-canonical NTP hydrolase)